MDAKMSLENHGASGSSGDGNVTRNSVDMELEGLIEVPIVEKMVVKKESLEDVVIGGTNEGNSGEGSGERAANDLSLAENNFVDVPLRSEGDKGKAICILDEKAIWAKEKMKSEEHEHSWIWKQGVGHSCWICDIVDEKWSMPPGFGSDIPKDIMLRVPHNGFLGTGICPHPLHKGKMKSHHVQSLNFICRNLAVENPNGCILAQVPTYEKSFLMISFIFGYLAKNPNSKPLFLLPKGMIEFWKQEFVNLEVNDVMLFDFPSAKATTRSQQLEVLKQWISSRSILFLSPKIFANMVSDGNDTEASNTCRAILLNTPSAVIFDVGTDPRNEMMRFLKVVARIKTPQKVLLTGSLSQTHIREVFNIIEVVFPEFLKHHQFGNKIGKFLTVDAAEVGGSSTDVKTFLLDKLEEAILSSFTDHGDRVVYLYELRMLTHNIIYNHKGVFLPEVPSLMDFTVVLKPTTSQRSAWEFEKNAKGKGFKTFSTLSGITLHPVLRVFSDRTKDVPPPNEHEIDEILQDIDVTDGVKTKFFLGLVKLCGHTQEKILVVSQHVIPLMFLQRLMAKIKGWEYGKETFMIKGSTSLDARKVSIDQFNSSPDARVFFVSIKACSERITLPGATRVVMMDLIANPCLVRQSIELAYHPGQEKKVYSYRLVAADTSEEEEEMVATGKEVIAGIWLDGKTYPDDGKFHIPSIDGKYCSDYFLGASFMKEDIKAIYKRLVLGFTVLVYY
ncbi:unnamed protein product [Microthlaspi erraticum]|uniref:Helicase C-terminal domain-containing protein n=1 Tax=Microthlaspi erraticum TaxID=1685480 RepID=A0A6D2J816_9BRAS|nr:unnamed protein product [Microthlaspi erraticum]